MLFKGGDDVPGWYGLYCQDDDDCQTFNPGTMHFRFGIRFDDNSAATVKGTSLIVPDKNYFVVGTCDGAAMRLYVEGKLEGTIQIGKNLPTRTSGDVSIGRRMSDDFPYWFNGTLDDVRIYNRALTDSEITLLHNERSGN
jgi:hypothetical protein